MKDYTEEEEPMIKKGGNCWELLLYNTKIQIIIVIILCVFIGIGTPFIWQEIWKIDTSPCQIESDLRYDCYPQRPTLHKNEEQCHESGCCWDRYATEREIQCYYGMVAKSKGEQMPGYKVEKSNEKSADLTVATIPYNLENDDPEHDYFANYTGQPRVEDKLNVTVLHYNTNHFSIKIMSKNETKRQIYPDFNPLTPDDSIGSKSNAKINWTSNTENKNKCKDCFSLSVRRRDSDQYIFNTGDFSPFIYSNGFIEITTLLPNDYIYGLGQSPSRSFKLNMTYPDDWSIFNKYNLDLSVNQTSWWGSHPFYMGWTNEKPKKAYGILLVNTYPIELITNSRPSLTFRTIGGNLHFHFFLGPTPREVIKQFYELVPKPSHPPYWALGFHMCRTECHLNSAWTVTEAMTKRSVPFESDCGSASLSARVFPTNFEINDLNAFYKKMSESGTKALVVQVPHKVHEENVENNPDQIEWQKVYDRWHTRSLVNSTLGEPDKPYKGYFYDWCGITQGNKSVIYPSFLAETEDIMSDLEKEMIKDLNIFDLGQLEIDGIFVDYNTPLDLKYNLTQNMSVTCQTILDKNEWNKYFYWKLNEYTPCLDTIHPKNGQDALETMATHNLYGHQHMKITKRALEGKYKKKNRKLVMSLSTFTGSGSLGGHIGTHMNATWDMLLQSHIQTLEFNMYGIPLTGFPVCGFKGQASDDELCLRWYQLAALQPFMIAHRDVGQNLTDPISVTKLDSMALQAIKSAIEIRYQLLPYLYTLFYRAHSEGEPPVRPLFYEFPEDDKTYKIDRQYMWGSALMVAPVVERKAKSVEAYFPKGIWYDYYGGRRMAFKDDQKLNVSALEYHINLYIKGGQIIPTQKAGQNTAESRKNNYTIIAALDLNRTASGELFIDDGLTRDILDDGKTNPDYQYLTHVFTVTSDNITIDTNITKESEELCKDLLQKNINTIVDTIKIYGIIDPLEPKRVNVSADGSDLSPYDKHNIKYDPSLGVLTLKGLDLQLCNPKVNQYYLSWSYMKWV